MNSNLTPEQIQTFKQQGYLHLPQAIPSALLSAITDTADSLLNDIYQQLKLGKIHPDHKFTCRYFQSYLNRICNFHHHAQTTALTLLGNTLIQNIANQLCHPKHVMTIDTMIVKNLGDELDIPWHQDIIFDPNKDNIIAVGIYLEPAHQDDGAFTFITNSQHQQHDIKKLTENIHQHQQSIATKAGDIIIHNPMLVHKSSPLVEQPLRRTLYYEFRNLTLATQTLSASHIKQRLQLEQQAITQYQQSQQELSV